MTASSSSEGFFGRKKQLELIRDVIESTSVHTPARLHVIALRGLGGIGKSRLVDELAKDLGSSAGSPTVVHVDLLRHESSFGDLLDVQRVLAQELFKVFRRPFLAFEKICLDHRHADLTSEQRIEISKCWVNDLRAALQSSRKSALVILDNYESIESKLDARGRRVDFGHAWIARIIEQLRDERWTILLSGRDLSLELLENRNIPLSIVNLETLDDLAVKKVIEQAGVRCSKEMLRGVLQATEGHPLALRFLLDSWRQGEVVEEARLWLTHLDTEIPGGDFAAGMPEHFAAEALKRILRYSWDVRFIPTERRQLALQERLTLAAMTLLEGLPAGAAGSFFSPPPAAQIDRFVREALSGIGERAAPVRLSFPSLFEQNVLRPEVRLLIARALESNSIADVDAGMVAGALSHTLEKTFNFDEDGGWSLRRCSEEEKGLRIIHLALCPWFDRQNFSRHAVLFLCRLIAECPAAVVEVARALGVHPGFAGTPVGRSLESHLVKAPPNFIEFLRAAINAGMGEKLERLVKILRGTLELRLKDNREAKKRRLQRPVLIRPQNVEEEIALFEPRDRSLAREICGQYLVAQANLWRETGYNSQAVEFYEWLLNHPTGFLRKNRRDRIVGALAGCYLKTARWDHLEKLAAKYPQRVPGLPSLPEVASKKDVWKDETLARCRDLLRQSPTIPDPLTEAVKLLEEVHALFPDCSSTLVLLARALKRSGEASALEEMLQKLRRPPPTARRWVMIGEIHLFRGELDKADDCLKVAESLLKSNSSFDSKILANIVNHRAEIATARGEVDTARSRFAERVFMAWKRAGFFEPASQNDSLKRMDIESAVAKHALTKWGYLDLVNGLFKEARSSFDSARDLDGGYLHALMGLYFCGPGAVTFNELNSVCAEKIRKSPANALWKLDQLHLAAMISGEVDPTEFTDWVKALRDYIKLYFMRLRIEASIRHDPGNEALPQLARILSQYLSIDTVV